nr:MFS transporter [Planctomonas sp. JC2975]
MGAALVTIAFLGAVIGGVGAPLITSVALDLAVPLDAAQWTLTVTLFSGAIAAPVLGRLGTGPHRRTTVLITLGLVALGGLLTAVPLPAGGFSFGVLLAGRALQGLGLGALALLMSVARDHLPPERARCAIATISVAGTVGIGIAYPLMGLVDQYLGLRAAYGLGFLISLTGLVIAWRAIPRDASRASIRIDIGGAVLLGIGTLGVLLCVAQPSVWAKVWVGATILVTAGIALAAWVVVERRSSAPLVDVRLLARAGLLSANAAMLVSGVGMYLLFSLLTRFVQTPQAAGYGFGLSGLAAGAALIPFSLFGFAAGRLTPWMTRLATARWAFVIHASFVAVAALVFATLPGSLIATLAAMAVLGFGVGGVSATMPGLVLAGSPSEETASVLSINQIVRSVGFSIGSALAGLLLATATPHGSVFPSENGYAIAAACVLPLLVLSAAVILVPHRR